MVRSHYLYLFAPPIIENVHRAIYMDSDMICNCDIFDLYSADMGSATIAVAKPCGQESAVITDAADFNSGMVMINMDVWRENNLSDKLLEFGRNLPKGKLCDQQILNQWFRIRNPNQLAYVDSRYNVFPVNCTNGELVTDGLIYHYSGSCPKPWLDGVDGYKQHLWDAAKETPFYEQFILSLSKFRMAEVVEEIISDGKLQV
ncbi:MAG: hypothetical protein LBR91_03965 [Puniceicoccales bacterium]|nr:hypothetical protein [Puniceicoccales bacterium]